MSDTPLTQAEAQRALLGMAKAMLAANARPVVIEMIFFELMLMRCELSE